MRGFVFGIVCMLAASMSAGYACGATATRTERAAVPELPVRGRIVSATLPTDEILLALVPPSRLLALSTFADDRAVSNVVDKARSVRYRVRGEPEMLLALQPSVVFAVPLATHGALVLVRDAGTPIVEIPHAENLADIRENIRRVGALVGEEQRAHTLIDGMDARVAAVEARIRGSNRPRVLLYNAGGYTAGQNTLFHDLVERAGGRNAAAEAGLRYYEPLPVETAFAIDPDVILVTHYRADAHSMDVIRSNTLAQDPVWRHLRAVREGRVRRLPENHLLSTSQYASYAALDIARALHPNEVADLVLP